MFLIAFETDDLPAIYFDALPNTWTHNRATAKTFETVQDAASFVRVWRLTEGVRIERA